MATEVAEPQDGQSFAYLRRVLPQQQCAPSRIQPALVTLVSWCRRLQSFQKTPEDGRFCYLVRQKDLSLGYNPYALQVCTRERKPACKPQRTRV